MNPTTMHRQFIKADIVILLERRQKANKRAKIALATVDNINRMIKAKKAHS